MTDMGLFDINKNYLIGSVNIFTTTLLAGLLGILIILQIKAYELNVSYTFSWRFFLYDPFASRFILIVLLALVAQVVSAAILMSGMFSHPVENNAVIFSMTSILWIVLYLATDFAFERWAMVPVLVLLFTLVVLLGQQLTRWRMRFLLFFISFLAIILPLVGRLTDNLAHKNLPERQPVIID